MNKTIFIYWGQGFVNAPALIQYVLLDMSYPSFDVSYYEKKRDYKEERQIDTKELLNAFEKEKQELAASYRQSLANKKERENK